MLEKYGWARTDLLVLQVNSRSIDQKKRQNMNRCGGFSLNPTGC
jgi:hypothetical protein